MYILTAESNVNSIVIYGFSTEGYRIASSIALRGHKVSIIDDSAGMAILLTPETAKSYPDVNSLTEDEPLLTVQPIDIAIKNASYIFFSPRIRKTGTEVKNHISLKFQDVVRHIGKNTSIIYTVPTGVGGNNENIAVIEHISGLTVGNDVNYYYFPTSLIQTNEFGLYIGTLQHKNDTFLLELLSEGESGSKINILDMGTAEYFHIINVVGHFCRLSSIFEICRHARDVGNSTELQKETFNDLFFDDLASGLYDLRIIQASLSGATPLMFLLNGSIKAIETYLKFLTDELRILLKRRDLKASKTRVIIAWSLDSNEMRGDKLDLLASLETKLKDYIGDVQINNSGNLYPSEKTTVIIACSKKDFAECIKGPNSDLIIKATPISQILD